MSNTLTTRHSSVHFRLAEYPSSPRSATTQMQQSANSGHSDLSLSGSTPAADHAQSSRRIFLGPIPHNVRTAEQEDNDATQLVSQHGLRIFLQQGGNIEDWTEAKAREYKERLKQRILESVAWHATSGSKNKRRTRQTVDWKGDTFEVGKVVGVNVNLLAAPDEGLFGAQYTRSDSDRPASNRSKSTNTVHWDDTGKTAFFTARPTLSSIGSSGTSRSPPPQNAFHATILGETSEDTHDEGNDLDKSTSSRTPLLSESTSHSVQQAKFSQTSMFRGAKSEGDLPETARPALKSILTSPGTDKGKAREVRYVEMPTKGAPSGSQSAAPPEEVLGRSPTEVDVSSASAVAEANEPTEDSSEAAMRDRMLVRVFRYEHESLKFPFVERDCRATRGLDSKEWDEFLVIWRNRRIELYEDYHTPCKERILGHKHLAFVIPLANKRTKLSLFSSVDLSFCLICPPTQTKSSKDRGHRSIFHRSPQGLNVFVMKLKSSSRAVDWIWKLWMELGGKLPESIEVSCPLVHSRVSIPIPDAGETWTILTRDFIVDQCNKAMDGYFPWQTVIQLPILNGRKLELCWRSGTKLDWVWLKDDVEGRKRDWEVLFGMALNYLGEPTQLEMHLASHYPTRVTTEDEKHLEEPPSIEGYATNYKRKTQARVQYYLSTHDGYLFAIQIEKVVTPPTPTDLKSFAKNEEDFRKDEHIRLRDQIMNARWFWDLRKILLVRRAVHVLPHIRDENVQASESGEPGHPNSRYIEYAIFQNQETELRRTDSDVADEGGDAGLAAAVDKGRLRMHRSFELVLKNGRILRFEAHSSKVAVEWVTHLRALVEYWKKRYRDDALTEMNIVKENLGEDRITLSRRYLKDGFRLRRPASNAEAATLYMDQYWHWCVLDACRQIVKSGQVFMKNKFRAQYRHAQLVLIRGCLVVFGISNDLSLRNHLIKRVNLIDAYVCSGYYAALALSSDECDPNSPPVAKLFRDGLETRDLLEDTLFLLWYRPHVHNSRADSNDTPIRNLNSQRKVAIFRARSKMERDAWCWALNCEIERLVRSTRDREVRIRGQGMPVS